MCTEQYVSPRLEIGDCLSTGSSDLAVFQLVIGLDAITDTAAIAALKTAKAALPNAPISLFYNPKGGVLYHSKTMFFKSPTGGQCLTGSGNLTLGGLRNNWEAFWTADVSPAEAVTLGDQWAKWVADNADGFLPLDEARPCRPQEPPQPRRPVEAGGPASAGSAPHRAAGPSAG